MQCYDCLYHLVVKRDFDTLQPIGAPEFCKLSFESLSIETPDKCDFFVRGPQTGYMDEVLLKDLDTGKALSNLSESDRETATQLLQNLKNEENIYTLYLLQKFLSEKNISIQPNQVEHILTKNRKMILVETELSEYFLTAIEILTVVSENQGSQKLDQLKKQTGFRIYYPNQLVKQGLLMADQNPRFLLGYKDSTTVTITNQGNGVLAAFSTIITNLLGFIANHKEIEISQVETYWINNCADAMVNLGSLLKDTLDKEKTFFPILVRLESKGLIDIEKVRGGNFLKDCCRYNENLVKINKKGEDVLNQKINGLKEISFTFNP